MSPADSPILARKASTTGGAPIIIAVAGVIALVAGAALVSSSPMLGLGGIYAGIFWLVAWRRPELALAAAFAAAPFQNDLSSGGPLQSDAAASGGGGGGVKFSLAEVNLALAIPVFLLMSWQNRQRLTLGPVTSGVVAYLGVCCFAAVANWHASSAPVSLVQMFLYLVIAMALFSYAVGAGMNMKPAFYGLAIVSTVIASAALVTRSGFVFDMHKNGVGGSLALGVIVCAELWLSDTGKLRRWLLAGMLVVISGGLIFTLSRGGWVEAAVGLLIVLALRRRVQLMLKLAIALVPVIVIAWACMPDDSKEYAAGFDSDRENIRLRYDSIDFARTQFMRNPMLGAGVGLRKEYDATNIALLTLAETGLPGFLAFLFMHAMFFRVVWRTQRMLSRDDARYCCLSVGAALVPAKLAHGLVDHYWSRGTIMLTWGSAGMALGVYFFVMRSLAAGAVEYEDQAATDREPDSIEPDGLDDHDPDTGDAPEDPDGDDPSGAVAVLSERAKTQRGKLWRTTLAASAQADLEGNR